MSNSDTNTLFHSNLNEHELPDVKFAIITIHDACPSLNQEYIILQKVWKH